jgi:hypothetical protein
MTLTYIEIARKHGLIFGNCPEFPESSEQIFAAMNEAVLAEREACAALCEKMKSDTWRDAIVTRAHNTAASNCAAFRAGQLDCRVMPGATTENENESTTATTEH